jgi:LPXTG-motif cell wall-anchored protein
MNHYHGILCPDGTGYKTLEPLGLGAIALQGLGMLAEDLGAPFAGKAERKARRSARKSKRKSRRKDALSKKRTQDRAKEILASGGSAQDVMDDLVKRKQVQDLVAKKGMSKETMIEAANMLKEPSAPGTDVIAEEFVYEQAEQSDNTMLFVGIGVAVLLLGGGAFFVTQKKKKAKSLKKSIPSAKPMQQLLNPRG